MTPHCDLHIDIPMALRTLADVKENRIFERTITIWLCREDKCERRFYERLGYQNKDDGFGAETSGPICPVHRSFLMIWRDADSFFWYHCPIDGCKHGFPFEKTEKRKWDEAVAALAGLGIVGNQIRESASGIRTTVNLSLEMVEARIRAMIERGYVRFRFEPQAEIVSPETSDIPTEKLGHWEPVLPQ